MFYSILHFVCLWCLDNELSRRPIFGDARRQRDGRFLNRSKSLLLPQNAFTCLSNVSKTALFHAHYLVLFVVLNCLQVVCDVVVLIVILSVECLKSVDIPFIKCSACWKMMGRWQKLISTLLHPWIHVWTVWTRIFQHTASRFDLGSGGGHCFPICFRWQCKMPGWYIAWLTQPSVAHSPTLKTQKH